jgi:hypothetical protein
LRVSTLTPDQQAMLAAWQQHTYAELLPLPSIEPSG